MQGWQILSLLKGKTHAICARRQILTEECLWSLPAPPPKRQKSFVCLISSWAGVWRVGKGEREVETLDGERQHCVTWHCGHGCDQPLCLWRERAGHELHWNTTQLSKGTWPGTRRKAVQRYVVTGKSQIGKEYIQYADIWARGIISHIFAFSLMCIRNSGRIKWFSVKGAGNEVLKTGQGWV